MSKIGYEAWSGSGYAIGHALGHGAFSKVYASGGAAVKVLSKADNSAAVVRAEVGVLQHLQRRCPLHPHLLQLLGVYEDARSVYIVTELLTGAQLGHMMQQQKILSEACCAWVVKQVCQALLDIHKAGCLHRVRSHSGFLRMVCQFALDLKPDNLMFAHPALGASIKLIDFGLATTMAGINSTEVCGSEFFTAPEVLESQTYTPACDMWAVGVIAYQLLAGHTPFGNDEDIIAKKLALEGEVWDGVSKECRDLITRLLSKVPSSRPTATAVLRHKWLNRAAAPKQPYTALHSCGTGYAAGAAQAGSAPAAEAHTHPAVQASGQLTRALVPQPQSSWQHHYHLYPASHLTTVAPSGGHHTPLKQAPPQPAFFSPQRSRGLPTAGHTPHHHTQQLQVQVPLPSPSKRHTPHFDHVGQVPAADGAQHGSPLRDEQHVHTLHAGLHPELVRKGSEPGSSHSSTAVISRASPSQASRLSHSHRRSHSQASTSSSFSSLSSLIDHVWATGLHPHLPAAPHSPPVGDPAISVAGAQQVECRLDMVLEPAHTAQIAGANEVSSESHHHHSTAGARQAHVPSGSSVSQDEHQRHSHTTGHTWAQGNSSHQEGAVHDLSTHDLGGHEQQAGAAAGNWAVQLEPAKAGSSVGAGEADKDQTPSTAATSCACSSLQDRVPLQQGRGREQEQQGVEQGTHEMQGSTSNWHSSSWQHEGGGQRSHDSHHLEHLVDEASPQAQAQASSTAPDQASGVLDGASQEEGHGAQVQADEVAAADDRLCMRGSEEQEIGWAQDESSPEYMASLDVGLACTASAADGMQAQEVWAAMVISHEEAGAGVVGEGGCSADTEPARSSSVAAAEAWVDDCALLPASVIDSGCEEDLPDLTHVHQYDQQFSEGDADGACTISRASTGGCSSSQRRAHGQDRAAACTLDACHLYSSHVCALVDSTADISTSDVGSDGSRAAPPLKPSHSFTQPSGRGMWRCFWGSSPGLSVEPEPLSGLGWSATHGVYGLRGDHREGWVDEE